MIKITTAIKDENSISIQKNPRYVGDASYYFQVDSHGQTIHMDLDELQIKELINALEMVRDI